MINTKFSFDTYLRFLVFCIPILLITGPFLPDLFLSLASVSYLVYLIKNKKYDYFNNKIFFSFILFFVILLISSLLSEYKPIAFKQSIAYLRFGIFILVIKYLFENKINISRYFFYLLIAIFLILFIDSLFQIIFDKNILGFVAPTGRITSFFGDDIKLGGYIARFSPLLIALAIYHNSSRKFTILILISSLTITFLSGERTSFIMTVLFSTIFILLYDSKFKIVLMSILPIIFVLFLNLNEILKYRLVTTTLNQLNIFKELPFYSPTKINNHHHIIHRDDSILPKIYLMYFETSKKIFLDNPIFGSGPRTYKVLSSDQRYFSVSNHEGYQLLKKTLPDNYKIFIEQYPEFIKKYGMGFSDSYEGFTNLTGQNSHPHNTYWQLLAETGLIGFIFIFFVFIYSIYKIITKTHLYHKVIFIGIFINLFPFFFSGNFFNNWLSILYFFPLGFLYIGKNDQKSTNKKI